MPIEFHNKHPWRAMFVRLSFLAIEISNKKLFVFSLWPKIYKIDRHTASIMHPCIAIVHIAQWHFSTYVYVIVRMTLKMKIRKKNWNIFMCYRIKWSAIVVAVCDEHVTRWTLGPFYVESNIV